MVVNAGAQVIRIPGLRVSPGAYLEEHVLFLCSLSTAGQLEPNSVLERWYTYQLIETSLLATALNLVTRNTLLDVRLEPLP